MIIDNYEVETIIDSFHLDSKILIAQIINFAIVFFVIYRFALEPLKKIMDERAEKIDKGLKDAQEVEERLKQAKEEQSKIIIDARKEAEKIIEKAKIQSEENQKKSLEKAKEEINKIINEERIKIKQEKETIFSELKKETVNLVILTCEKFLGKKIDKQENQEIIKLIINH